MGRERHQRTVDAQASAQHVVIGAIVIHGLHDALFRLLPQGVALVEGAQPLFGEVVEQVVAKGVEQVGLHILDLGQAVVAFDDAHEEVLNDVFHPFSVVRELHAVCQQTVGIQVE